MITYKQLSMWRKEIIATLENALNLASKFSENKDMCAYYTHLAKTASAQLSLIQKLCIQSVTSDEDAGTADIDTKIQNLGNSKTKFIELTHCDKPVYVNAAKVLCLWPRDGEDSPGTWIDFSHEVRIFVKQNAEQVLRKIKECEK